VKTLFRSLCLTLIALAACGQTTTPPSPAPPQQQPTADSAATSSNYTSAKGFVLEDGTPIKMRINRTISSADAHIGDTVDFEVPEDISVNGTPVIAKGGLAFATVTEAQSKRRMARGGKLDINIDYVKLLSSEKAALRAVKDMKGGGHTGAMVGGMVATSIVFFPAAPFFLFMHGKDTSIPKGTEITAYVNGDMKLDLAKFQPNSGTPPSATEASNPTANATTAKLRVDSDPSGADIEIDGSFVGNTPSDVQLAEGDHTITVKKTGFQNWERKMKISGGSSVHVNAGLEKSSAQ
jgi:predicted small lipoprotein YifL